MWLGKVVCCFLILGFGTAFGQPRIIPKPKNTKKQAFVGKVIRILDGDTMEVLHNQRPFKIRLAHIDCPEAKRSQPFGQQAKKALAALCFGQQVVVLVKQSDRYGRLIAVVVNRQKQVLNFELMKQGLAWHFKKYSTDPIYAQLELQARKNKLGLWQDPHAIAPWEWRKPKPKSTVIQAPKF